MQGMGFATRSYGGVTAEERRATRRAALIEAALISSPKTAQEQFRNVRYVRGRGSMAAISMSISPTRMPC